MGTWGKLLAVLIGISVSVLIMALLALSPLTRTRAEKIQMPVAPITDVTVKTAETKLPDPPLVVASLPRELTPPARTSVAADEIKIVTNNPVVEVPVAKPAPVAPVATKKQVAPAPKAQRPVVKTSFVRAIKRWFDGIFEQQR